MVKIGILSDTHIRSDSDPQKTNALLKELKRAFRDVDHIVHAGDVCEEPFLEKLKKIAPTKCVRGNMDDIPELKSFLRFSIGKYTIGVIHQLPSTTLEEFFREHKLHILIYGHSHQPLIKGTEFNTLLINPGSPTRPKAPAPRRGFTEPVARPSVITLEIDEDDMIKTFLINLKM